MPNEGGICLLLEPPTSWDGNNITTHTNAHLHAFKHNKQVYALGRILIPTLSRNTCSDLRTEQFVDGFMGIIDVNGRRPEEKLV